MLKKVSTTALLPLAHACQVIKSIGEGQIEWEFDPADCVEFTIDAEAAALANSFEWRVVKYRNGRLTVFASNRWKIKPSLGLTLHHAIAHLFNPLPPVPSAYWEIRFRNGDWTDLRANNLEWVVPGRYFGA